MGPDPKPLPRVRLPRKQWTSLWRQIVAGKYCRLCGERAETAHHIVARNKGGDDVGENLMEVCGDGTRGCHGRIEARDPETCAAVRTNLRGSELEYVLRKKGEAWLERRYPL
jgi:5-methylcytosine-specific restriction endonuclease McrA